MKKLVVTFVVLLFTYLGLKLLFLFLNKGDNHIYEIRENGVIFNIKEDSYFNDKLHNYYYQIGVGNTLFSFQIFENFNKNLKVIENIKYYKDNEYECILPIFKKNKILTDIMCLKDNTMFYYHDINNEKIKQFANNIGYNMNFINNQENKVINGVKIYNKNLIDNHYIGITNYKGIYNISSNFNSLLYNITLFDKDIYNQKIGVFLDGYYIVADYNNIHEFNKINVIDLVNLNTFTINSDDAISIDSYIQGVYDDIIYLYDKDKKVQYEIDIKNKKINKNNNIKYYNLEWTIIDNNKANEEVKFIYNIVDYKDEDYVKIDKVGNSVGYYYLYKKIDNKYYAYRINIQNKDNLTYLFSLNNINNIYYVDDYVYFIDDNKIMVYNDRIGVRTLVEYNELQFNKNINFNVYSK